jgi:endonuclease/exonuclease/phosphatase family metal-dependent hydrolase
MERILSRDIVNSHRYGDGPRILLGDFNSWWPVRSAREVHTHFHDACVITGRKRLRTFGRFFEYLCLDHIFTSRDCEILQCQVLATGKARVASDHRPLVCTLRLPGSPP